MRIKRFSAVASAALLIALTACSSSTDKSASPVDSGPVSLTFWTWV